jgi:hypothetical protein
MPVAVKTVLIQTAASSEILHLRFGLGASGRGEAGEALCGGGIAGACWYVVELRVGEADIGDAGDSGIGDDEQDCTWALVFGT